MARTNLELLAIFRKITIAEKTEKPIEIESLQQSFYDEYIRSHTADGTSPDYIRIMAENKLIEVTHLFKAFPKYPSFITRALT